MSDLPEVQPGQPVQSAGRQSLRRLTNKQLRELRVAIAVEMNRRTRESSSSRSREDQR